MPECTICGSYTKFTMGLCTSCYHNRSVAESLPDLPSSDAGISFSEKDRMYRYNMIKGRIAETLIQELFLSLKYNVFRYGMENTIPGIMDLLKGVRSDVADDIKRMPDFVIQNPNTKDVHFIEVKFRANGEFRFRDLPKNYPYTNAFIIIVSKRHIKCVTVEELQNGHDITPESKNYLGYRKEFDLNKDIIIDFCKFAIQFFEGV